LDPRAALGTVKAFVRGGKQGLTQGDAWQQGGVLVVDKDSKVLWQHANDHPDDNASVDAIVRAL
jgi:hypothetical protein